MMFVNRITIIYLKIKSQHFFEIVKEKEEVPNELYTYVGNPDRILHPISIFNSRFKLF